MNLRVKNLNLENFTRAPPPGRTSPSSSHHPPGRGKLLIAPCSILSKIFFFPSERKLWTPKFCAEKIRRRNVAHSLELQQHPIENFRLFLSMSIFIICYLIAKYFSLMLCPQQEGVPSVRVGLPIRICTWISYF